MYKYKFIDLIVTFNCNATCSHCNVKNNGSIFISLDKVKKFFENLKDNLDKEVFLTFHGGEALLIGCEKLEEIILYLNSTYNNKFNYSIQTNLLNYDKKWGKLFIKYNIKVSTSYDFFTDIRNIKGDTKKYWNIWYKNVKQIQKFQHKILVLTVIDENNHDKYKEIYKIAKNENFNFLFLNFYEENITKTMKNSVYYKKFLNGLFEVYWNDFLKNGKLDDLPVLNPLTYMIKNFLFRYNAENYCTFNNNCLNNKLLITPDKEYYTCLSFYNYGIKQKDLLNLTELLYPKECISCKYYNYCKGGCLLDRKLKTPNLLCEVWKSLFEKLEKIKNDSRFDKYII